MALISTSHSDLANFAIIAACAALARYAPMTMLFLSFAFLGPAHYLTQIPWMKERGFFVDSTKFEPTMWILSAFIILFGVNASSFYRFDVAVSGFFILVALAVASLSGIFPPSKSSRKITIASFGILFALLALDLFFHDFRAGAELLIFIGLAVSTIFHVYLCTAAFMISGALKSKSPLAVASVALLFLAGASFFIFPVSIPIDTLHGTLGIFAPLAEAIYPTAGGANSGMALRFGQPQASSAENPAFAFLAFIYTFHYLNWFAKSDSIRWNDVDPMRALKSGAIYLAILGCYASSVSLGISVSMFFAYAHVLLELPLDIFVFRELLAKLLGSKLR